MPPPSRPLVAKGSRRSRPQRSGSQGISPQPVSPTRLSANRTDAAASMPFIPRAIAPSPSGLARPPAHPPPDWNHGRRGKPRRGSPQEYNIINYLPDLSIEFFQFFPPSLPQT